MAEHIRVIDREKSMPKSQKLKIPFSGSNKRRFLAEETRGQNERVILEEVTWSIDPQPEGISIDNEGLLVILPNAEPGTIQVIAKSMEDESISGKTQVEIEKTTGRDIPPNPLEKEGWKLYFHDEFNGERLDQSAWVGQYLRNWSDDIHSQANYTFEDGAIIVKADIDSKRWSPFDPNECSSLSSFEKAYLHRFGSNVNESSRHIPTFDGITTKYGYFEIRAKLPDTGDGSHVAWWMVGAQDDQNINPTIDDPTVADRRSSNETGEVDIIEIGLDELNSWRPVMHPNDSTSLEYLHVPETKLDFDPGNEFHIYGYEWDEEGTKYYVDNELVQVTDRTFDYRMMTFLGVYAQGGMGKANKIFPKEFVIDYFRVYKRDEKPQANDIRFHEDDLIHTIRKPREGEKASFAIPATTLDQFDQAIESELEWSFSASISGEDPKEVGGARIDCQTGKIILTDALAERADLFVTAKVKEHQSIKKVFHVRVASEPAVPQFIRINNQQGKMKVKIPNKGKQSEVMFTAELLDQYSQPIEGKLVWQLAKGTGLNDKVDNVTGVSIDQEKGIITVTDEVKEGLYLFIQAKSVEKKKAIDEFILDQTIYAHRLIQFVK